jgi:hypothetical protein
VELPAVGENVSLSEAYETLKASGKSGLGAMPIAESGLSEEGNTASDAQQLSIVSPDRKPA